MLGLQYSDYAISKNQHNQSFQLLNFISNVSKERHLDKSKILVSSMQLNNGVIIKIKNTYYQVNLSTDQNSYTLTKTHLMNDQIIIKK
ncbi:hypothetical protein FD46_GL001042 [Liquorilactobacillus oeni DSM 19972]|uniref:Uncharacterized protein n=2 Tax=Liquorilactobacillus oeni TaxID=303241 RepID=A0A0R1MB45_9LACO|nr:hypothetical protein FD46_GL001042 [Liquorilactobacillus oeni DSM 19972]